MFNVRKVDEIFKSQINYSTNPFKPEMPRKSVKKDNKSFEQVFKEVREKMG